MTGWLHDLANEAVYLHYADQKATELAVLGSLIKEYHARTAIEIGTYRGGTAWFFHMLGLQVQTIDIDQSRVDEKSPGVQYVEGRSDTVEGWRWADVIFIDGDHSLAGVTEDWRCYAARARQLIVFHDIVEHLPETGCQVSNFWQDIKRDHVTVEIVDPRSENGKPWAGIGVICV